MLPISRLMTDDRFFGRQFGGESFAAWRALLSGFYGEELTEKQRETFIDLTHREPPNEALSELWMAIGRRGGKSQAAGLIAVHEAFLSEPQAMLAPGEWATVLIVASDRKQARTVRRYIKGLIEQNEMFEKMVQRETSDGLELKNRVAIEIGTASIRALRGYTVLAVIADEIAFWHADGANPDAEIINSVRPALGTLGGKLIALSSPYARRGMLWNTYRRHFANGDSRVLVAQAPTRIMNPTFPEHLVQEAMDEDPSAARAEYLAWGRRRVRRGAFDSDAITAFDRTSRRFSMNTKEMAEKRTPRSWRRRGVRYSKRGLEHPMRNIANDFENGNEFEELIRCRPRAKAVLALGPSALPIREVA